MLAPIISSTLNFTEERNAQLVKVLVGFDYSIVTHRCDHHSRDAPPGQTCSQLIFGIQSNPPELSGQSLC